MVSKFKNLTDNSVPVFILDKETLQVLQVNQFVQHLADSDSPVGKPFSEVVDLLNESDTTTPALFNNRWYQAICETEERLDENQVIVRLVEQPFTPPEETLFIVKKMLSVLVHRVRSPLTAIQGHLDLFLEKKSKKQERDRFVKISDSTDYILDMMDDFEILYHALSEEKDPPRKEPVDPQDLIKSVLSTYSADEQKRFQIKNSLKDTPLTASPTDLYKIVKYLMDNALEHPTGKKKEILIEITEPHCIKVTNSGDPIPPSMVDHIFYPLVTDKAQSVGIGLTLAQMMANRQGGAIFLTHNTKDQVTFTLCLPPQ